MAARDERDNIAEALDRVAARMRPDNGSPTHPHC